MKKTEAIEVGFKVLSIYAFMQGIAALAMPISLLETERLTGMASRLGAAAPSHNYSALAFLPSALLFILGAVLWLNSKQTEVSSIAKESSADVTGLTPHILQNIIFSALGILIVVESLASFGSVVSALNIYALARHNSHLFMGPFPYYRLAEGLLRLIFGLWLIIGSRGLRKFESWLLKDW